MLCMRGIMFSIYAIDCDLVQSLNDVPGGRVRGLKVAVRESLQSWTLHKQNQHEVNCVQSVHLWDALMQVTGELKKLPGRRVILAVTDGAWTKAVATLGAR